jgi:DNA-binding LacI/PurR family transcriptional regulator
MAVQTKSENVTNFIRQQIAQGRWTPNKRLPSERDLLKTLDVSRATLRDSLATLEAEGLVTRRHGSGTYVAPREVRATQVALVCRTGALVSPYNYFLRKILDVSYQEIKAREFQPVIAAGEGRSIEEFVSSVHLFEKHAREKLAGILCLSTMGEFGTYLGKEGIPYVTFGSSLYSKYSIFPDYNRLVTIALDELARIGFAHDFTVVMEDLPHDGHFPFLPELERQLSERTSQIVRVPFQSLYPEEIFKHAYDMFKRLCLGPNRPKAVFFMDDMLCEAGLLALMELGIQVPRDMVIITQSNVDRQFQFPVSITSVDFDPKDVAKQGWQLLKKVIDHRETPETSILIEPRLKKGQSL